jgi:hypothetical protein
LQIVIHIRTGKESTRFVSSIEREKGKTQTARTTRRIFFDYFVFNIVDYIAPLRASAVPCYARGLAVVHSRKLSATLGGSTSTRLGVWKLTIKTSDFINISNTAIPTALGGSTTTLPPIVVVILRQQLDYAILDYDYAASNKS